MSACWAVPSSLPWAWLAGAEAKSSCCGCPLPCRVRAHCVGLPEEERGVGVRSACEIGSFPAGHRHNATGVAKPLGSSGEHVQRPVRWRGGRSVRGPGGAASGSRQERPPLAGSRGPGAAGPITALAPMGAHKAAASSPRRGKLFGLWTRLFLFRTRLLSLN